MLTSIRDLDGALIENKSLMTIEMCIQYCYIKNFKYAGVQFGYQCFCGNSEVRIFGIVPETECNQVCVGNFNQICGDSNRNSIYIITGKFNFNKI